MLVTVLIVHGICNSLILIDPWNLLIGEIATMRAQHEVNKDKIGIGCKETSK